MHLVSFVNRELVLKIDRKNQVLSKKEITNLVNKCLIDLIGDENEITITFTFSQ